MSCSSSARTGRHRQRYQDQFRLVAGCIPFRFERVNQNYRCNSADKLRVLMISTPNRHDLVFPKGGWEDDEEVTDAASREALEEAGVKGTLSEKALGVWEFRSKSSENSCSPGGGCKGYMYAMEVTEELDSWPEQAIYVRKWLTVDEAFELCRYDWMREALRRLLTLLSEDDTQGRREEMVELPKSSLPDSDHDCQNLLSPGYFIRPSGVLRLDKSYTRNRQFGIIHFLGISSFHLKCRNVFTIFRTLSYLERKAEATKRKPHGPLT